jgi:hypothetical protein
MAPPAFGNVPQTMSKKFLYRNYHICGKKRNIKPKDSVRELNMRVEYTKRFYRGRYDKRHWMWMKRLAEVAVKDDASIVDMSLDAYAVYRKLNKRG